MNPQHQPAYNHCGLVSDDDQPPHNSTKALEWIHSRQQALVDRVWGQMTGLASRPVNSILDAGCGQGGTLARFAAMAAPRQLDLTGITLEQSQIDIAGQHLPQAGWLVGDMLNDRGLPGRRFDVVVALQSTEYIGASNLQKFMKQAAFWLVDKGVLAIAAGSWSAETATENPAIKLFNRLHPASLSTTDDYRRTARAAGFQTLSEQNLRQPVMNYWRVRRDHPALWSSPEGVMEQGFYLALKQDWADYRLYVWEKTG